MVVSSSAGATLRGALDEHPSSRATSKPTQLAVTLGLVFFAVLAAYAIARHPHLSGNITFGDALVGLGTLLLAIGTAGLAVATFAIDRRAAGREQERRRREVRGIARLIDAEVRGVEEAVLSALTFNRWLDVYDTTHSAWDRGAALLVPELSEDEALYLVNLFGVLSAWARGAAALRPRSPFPPSNTPGFALTPFDVERLTDMKELLDLIGTSVWELAYDNDAESILRRQQPHAIRRDSSGQRAS